MSTTGTPRTKSLGRAVQLLRAVAARSEGTSASELARATRLPRSTAARTLRTLADFELVEASPSGGGWVLGRELVRLARAADPHRQLLEAAVAPLHRLRDAAGESALLAVPRRPVGMDILFQLDPDRHVGVADWVGSDVPLHASSAGKLVLADLADDQLAAWLAAEPPERFTPRTLTRAGDLRAELARVRRRGWAELVDELEDGHSAVSVPVRAPDGSLAAMVGISGPTFRLSRSRRRELLVEVLAAAARIERALGAGIGSTGARA